MQVSSVVIAIFDMDGPLVEGMSHSYNRPRLMRAWGLSR
jgi:hypothetical protein